MKRKWGPRDPYAPCTLRGRLLLLDGTPLADATVGGAIFDPKFENEYFPHSPPSLADLSEDDLVEQIMPFETNTDEEGYFSFYGRPGVIYEMRVWRETDNKLERFKGQKFKRDEVLVIQDPFHP